MRTLFVLRPLDKKTEAMLFNKGFKAVVVTLEALTQAIVTLADGWTCLAISPDEYKDFNNPAIWQDNLMSAEIRAIRDLSHLDSLSKLGVKKPRQFKVAKPAPVKPTDYKAAASLFAVGRGHSNSRHIIRNGGYPVGGGIRG